MPVENPFGYGYLFDKLEDENEEYYYEEEEEFEENIILECDKKQKVV